MAGPDSLQDGDRQPWRLFISAMEDIEAEAISECTWWLVDVKTNPLTTTCWIYCGITLNPLYWPACHDEALRPKDLYEHVVAQGASRSDHPLSGPSSAGVAAAVTA